MNYIEFIASLEQSMPPTNLSILLKALWYDKKGDWDQAHDLADGMPGADAAWVHAYLHRKEGDQWNANYWYRRAGKSSPGISLDSEWENLLKFFLQ